MSCAGCCQHPTRQRLRAVPRPGLNVPIWLLGSKHFSALQAGRQLGLPFAFAGRVLGQNYLHLALSHLPVEHFLER